MRTATTASWDARISWAKRRKLGLGVANDDGGPGRDRSTSEDRILLTDMVFHGRHGTLPAENELGQPFIVSVELNLDLRPAGTSDDLTKTVDYGAVHRVARDIMEGPPAHLTATVAERIAAGTLESHVRWAAPYSTAAVEILRRQEARS